MHYEKCHCRISVMSLLVSVKQLSSRLCTGSSLAHVAQTQQLNLRGTA